MTLAGAVIGFLISLLISAVIVYVSAKLLGEREGFGTAVVAAFAGAFIFAIVYYILGTGWIAALVAGIGWLIALGKLYSMGWLKSFVVAIVIWLITSLVSLVFPSAKPL